MGCGYSKINISSRRGRLKERVQADPDSEENDYGCNFSPGKVRKPNTKGCNSDILRRNGVSNTFNNEESLASRRRIANKIKPISGPMRPPLTRSASQVDFFRMLDEKIANGKDFSDDDDFDYAEFKVESNCIHQPVPPSCSLVPPSPREDKITLSSPAVTRKSRSRSPSPNTLKPASKKMNHKATDHELTEVIPIGVSFSPKRPFRDEFSSNSSSRSSSANVRSLSADGKTRQVEVECHINANMFNSNEDMQMNLNNYEISKDYSTHDTSDKVIPINPPQLSNGQVHS